MLGNWLRCALTRCEGRIVGQGKKKPVPGRLSVTAHTDSGQPTLFSSYYIIPRNFRLSSPLLPLLILNHICKLSCFFSYSQQVFVCIKPNSLLLPPLFLSQPFFLATQATHTLRIRSLLSVNANCVPRECSRPFFLKDSKKIEGDCGNQRP